MVISVECPSCGWSGRVPADGPPLCPECEWFISIEDQEGERIA